LVNQSLSLGKELLSMDIVRGLGLVGAFLITFSPITYSSEPLAVLDPNSPVLNEVYKDEVPVSGKVIAGVGMSGLAVKGVLALFPKVKSSLGFACVQVMSRDGRYWAENTFVLPEIDLGDGVQVSYPSKYNNLLNEYSADDLAILSYSGRCEKKKVNNFMVTTRQKLVDKSRALIVYVNSSRADTYIRVMNDSTKKVAKKCRKITEGRRTGYDTICRVDMPEETSAVNPVKLSVYRRKFNKSLKPVQFLVALPELN